MTHRPRRSVLYMPGSNARALEKGKTLQADALILDLEDAVAPDAKLSARDQVCAAVKAGGYGSRELVIRVNGSDTPWGRDDLAAAIDAEPDAILLPKVSDAEDVDTLSHTMNREGAAAKTRAWVMMETPQCILNAGDIAAAAGNPGSRLSCFVMGLNDLVKETRSQLSSERSAALYWLSASITAARAHGLDVVDGVYNNFKDAEGFARECAQGRMLGMDGKTLIHPGQIEACNEAFSPTDDEVEWARRIIGAFDEPETKGKGVITVDGRMVELLHVEAARRTVAIAEAIAALSEG